MKFLSNKNDWKYVCCITESAELQLSYSIFTDEIIKLSQTMEVMATSLCFLQAFWQNLVGELKN